MREIQNCLLNSIKQVLHESWTQPQLPISKWSLKWKSTQTLNELYGDLALHFQNKEKEWSKSKQQKTVNILLSP